MIHHHLSDEMIMAYAAGSLSAGQSMVVACHLDICPDCARRVAEAEVIGGAMIDDVAPSDLSDGLFEQILLDVEEDQSFPVPQIGRDEAKEGYPEGPVAGENPSMPRILFEMIGGDFGAVRWRTVGPGIKQFLLPVPSSEGEKVRLLKLSPGFVTPDHSHHGSELTLVLKGSFSDETGRYRAGDIQDAEEDRHHQPIADTEEDCICLVCTDAPLEFKGVITRLLQPIIGI
ncbi:ChrR family anti-sigma-E factor [uncultured Cohaesibacter sp.]|uniref:ChrR family anti-sigma-E factor n=1 Tax=uncultured Cohaesibacter sp. TaxID=1002546 RepID=UPI0029C934D2|nr:ChrR family anti-sigma-E factor [uncultured Cohaesibacter sp.]